MKTRIFTSDDAATLLEFNDNGLISQRDNDHPVRYVVWPELKHTVAGSYAMPRHAADTLELCKKLHGRTILTMDEHVFLYFLHQIREEEFDMTVGDVEMYFVRPDLNAERLKVTDDGDFARKFPSEHGFFDTRFNLLF